MSWNDPLFLAQLLSTTFLCGLIWTIQLVHYPAFRDIDVERFVDFHRRHSAWITVVVLPVMLTELLSAGLMWMWRPSFTLAVNLGSVVLIWIATFALSVPLHARLKIEKDPVVIERLIQTNWVRTLGWSGRLVALLITINSSI